MTASTSAMRPPAASKLAFGRILPPGPTRARLRAAALPVYKPTGSRLLPSWGRYLLMRPAVFEAWYRARALRFRLTHGLRSHEDAPGGAERGFVQRVASYNQSKLWEFFRVRTEKLMALLRCIDEVPADPRILVIGPRNEAEILLLSLYGFPLERITGLDLFSYSPLVEVGDMHAIPFADDTFDVVYTAWTLKYSYDLPRACAEVVRVLRPGGIVVTGFSHTQALSEVIGAPIRGGLDEMLGHFAPHVDHVYWQEVAPVAGTDASEVTAIFRIRKEA